MNRPMTERQSPAAFVSSTVGTTLISIAAVWLVTSHAFVPVVAKTGHRKHRTGKESHQLSTHPLYRWSPIPAGADWTS